MLLGFIELGPGYQSQIVCVTWYFGLVIVSIISYSKHRKVSMPFPVLTVSSAMKWKLAQSAQNPPVSSSMKLGPYFMKLVQGHAKGKIIFA